jgi:AraC family transcriptional regulator
MRPRIKIITEKKLVGKRLKMSRADNKTDKLWKSFIPRRKEITNNLTGDLISMSVYDRDYFENFNPSSEFEKWAAIEVSDFDKIPDDMEHFILAGGLYAVFNYKGSSDDISIFLYIFGSWLPNSDYNLDDRPHFEVLGNKYKNKDPKSEEQIWIPIKPK